MARFVTYSHADRQGFGLLEGNFIHDLSESFPELKGKGLAGALRLRTPDELIALAQQAGIRVPLDAVQLLPPVTDGEKCLCVGLNFKDHAREAGLPIPGKPSLFARYPSSFVGHGQSIVAPSLSAQFDFEGELVVVIGRGGRHLPESHAIDHVLGYTIMAENSVRDWQKHSSQVTAGKNFFHSGALGPWCVTRDACDDASPFNIVTRLNGAVVQNGSTDDFIFSIPQIISYVSSFAMLLPGDMIALGTPSGVGMGRQPPLWLKVGDVLEVEIQGIGALRNSVVAEMPGEIRSP
jgi:2-keto-4-pentenoate hydratase/2-oxohepta-3-ene-1,7-dioic acid hydratase in catechol pathway